MPSVCDLPRFGRSLPRSFGKCASAIPANDFYAGMCKQPLFERLGFSIGNYEGLLEVLSTLKRLFSSL